MARTGAQLGQVTRDLVVASGDGRAQAAIDAAARLERCPRGAVAPPQGADALPQPLDLRGVQARGLGQGLGQGPRRPRGLAVPRTQQGHRGLPPVHLAFQEGEVEEQQVRERVVVPRHEGHGRILRSSACQGDRAGSGIATSGGLEHRTAPLAQDVFVQPSLRIPHRKLRGGKGRDAIGT